MYRYSYPCLCTVMLYNSLIINEIKQLKNVKKSKP